MASRLTHMVAVGATFEEFLFACARDMGFGVHQRDEPAGPIKQLDVRSYAQERLKALQADLAKRQAMTPGEVQVAFETRLQQLRQEREVQLRAKQALRLKYEAMLTRAEAWVPPTPNHEDLKALMIRQLSQALEHDCRLTADVAAELETLGAQEWHRELLDMAKESVERAIRRVADEETERTAHNTWVAQLHESLRPGPPSQEPAP